MAGYMPGKRGWIKRRTRKAFLTAAATLLSERSFLEISVIDVCEIAEIPRATFYNYFADKYDLVRSAASDLVERIEGYKAEENATEEKILNDILDVVLGYCKSQADFLPVFFKVEGLIAGVWEKALGERFAKDLSLDGQEREMTASAIVAGVKQWMEDGCVVEIEEEKRRILAFIGRAGA